MNTQNNKILFVVYDILQYRNYFKTEALKEIKDKIVILANSGLANMDFGIPKDRVFFYSYPGDKEIYHRRVFFINSWQNSKRVPVFLLRLALLKPKQKIAFRIASLPVLSDIIKFIFLKRAEDKKLFELVREINPSLILLPSGAFEGVAFELIGIGKKIKTPSFMLVDNWDTLATKTVFTTKPDYLGVWSRQQVEHAVDIREMPREKVFVVGVPRFMEHLKPESKCQPSLYPFKYILFAGSANQYDELGALHKIDETIDRLKLDLKVVFRPALNQHTRNCPDVFFEYNFKHVILDTPARRYYKRGATWDTKDPFNPINAPDMSYYPKLLANMEFMVCPVSTMVLEASLYNKKVFALVYPDDIHKYHLKYRHDKLIFPRGIERLTNVRMVHDFNDLEKIFDSGDPLRQNAEPLDVDYFVSKEAIANYPTNLKKIVDEILTQD